MKKYILVTAFCISLTLSLSAQQVTQEQRSMLTKVSATWCPPCGGWGWDMFDDLVEDNDEKALLIANHYSGDLRNPTAEAIAANFENRGQPSFFLGSVDQNVTSSNTTARRASIKEQIDANFELLPVANAGLTAQLVDNTIEVQAQTRFFQDTEGEFYLAVYIVEDGVIADQASRGNNVEHKKIMRESFSDNHFGTQLNDAGVVTQGSSFITNYSYDVPDGWVIENMDLALVIWSKQADDSYEFVNTYVEKDWLNASATSDLFASTVQVSSYPTLGQGLYTTRLTLTESVEALQLSIVSETGQTVELRSLDNLPAGQHEIQWDLTQQPSGKFFVRASAGSDVRTEMIVKQ